jgi:PEP-CTERM motif
MNTPVFKASLTSPPFFGLLPAKLPRLVAAIAACVLTSASWAQTITFAAHNIADAVVGQDLWQYDYVVAGSLPEFNAYNLIFSPASYSDIQFFATSHPTELDVLVTQPDSNLQADGQATVTALTTLNSGFAANLSLRFVWAGPGAPAAQSYQILDDSFNVVDTRQTLPTTPIPEPEVAYLMLAGLAGVAFAAKRRARKVVSTQ